MFEGINKLKLKKLFFIFTKKDIYRHIFYFIFKISVGKISKEFISLSINIKQIVLIC